MKYYLTYEELKTIAKDVAEYLRCEYNGECNLVAVTRGGVAFGQLVAYEMSKPLHYYSPPIDQILWTTEGSPQTRSEPLIFLEDIIAEGRTFRAVDAYMDSPEMSNIGWEFIPVVMDHNAPSDIKKLVNRVGKVSSEWVVFPHEEFDLTVEGDRGLFREGTSVGSTVNKAKTKATSKAKK